MDDDELVDCPNCQCLTPQSDLRPITIGAVFRYAKRIEKAQHALIKSGQAHTSEGKAVPLKALFSNQNVNWIPMPPVIEQLHYNIQNIGQQHALQKKDIHICGSCFDAYADDEEVKYRLVTQGDTAEGMSNNNSVGPLSSARVSSARRAGAAAGEQDGIFIRRTDRKMDFAFTSLQSSIRSREKMIDDKRKARQKWIEAHPSDIDWEGLPATATKEIKQIQDAAASSPPRGHELALTSEHALVPYSNELVDASSSPKRAAHARLGSARSTASVVLPTISSPLTDEEVNEIYSLAGHTIPISEDPMSSFDVPVQHRFMHELWSKMCIELEFGADDAYLYLTDVKGDHLKHKQQQQSEAPSPVQQKLRPASSSDARQQSVSWGGATDDPAVNDATTCAVPPSSDKRLSLPDSGVMLSSMTSPPRRDEKVPVRHPFFLLYRKNQLRLPTPPVPLMLQKPNVVSTAANVEDALLRVDNLVLANSRKIRRDGMQDKFISKELSEAEQQLLGEVVGNPDIVVDDDDDDEMFTYSGEEDEEFMEDDDGFEDGFDDQ